MEEYIQLALWIPFGLTLLVSGLIFTISGFKRGIWKALLGLGATAVSGLLAVLIARLCALPLAQWLVPQLARLMEQSMQMPTLPVATLGLVQNLAQVVISLVVYSGVFFTLTIVLRIVLGKIGGIRLLGRKTWQKLTGMAVGFAAAVVYSVLLLLPLYGTVNAYVPAVISLTQMVRDEQAKQVSQQLERVMAHPVVQMSGSAPAQFLYDQLANVQLEGGAVNVVQMTQAMTDSMNALQNFWEAENDQERLRLAAELIQVLREEVVEQPWFYTMAQEVLNQLQGMFSQEELSSPEGQLILEMMQILRCPEETFGENCGHILDFLHQFLLEDVPVFLEADDPIILYESGFLQRAGALANVSEEAVAMKMLLLRYNLSTIMDGDQQAAQAFLERYGVNEPTAPEDQAAEAGAVLMAMGEMNPIEMVACHPKMGHSAVTELIRQLGFLKAIGAQELTDPALLTALQEDTLLQQAVLEQLAEFSGEPMGTAADLQTFLLRLEELYLLAQTGQMDSGFSLDPSKYRQALAVMGRQRYAALGAVTAEQEFTFLEKWVCYTPEESDAFSSLDVQWVEVMDFYPNNISSMILLIRLSGEGQMPQNRDQLQQIPADLLLASCIRSEGIMQTVKTMLTESGSDPLALSGHLNKNQKKLLRTLVEEAAQSQAASEEDAVALQEFFGL